MLLKKYCALLVALLIIPLNSFAGQEPITEVFVITPFLANGGINPYFIKQASAKGSCLTHSLSDAARPDAWRCESDGKIYDPCFKQFGEAGLLCMKSPWDRKVVVLEEETKEKAQMSETFDKKAMPWAIRLKEGEHCTFLTGATRMMAGMRVNYACAGKGFLVGELDQSRAQWSIFYTDDSGVLLRQRRIEIAWY